MTSRDSALVIGVIVVAAACSTGDDRRPPPPAQSILPPDSAINPIVVRLTDEAAESGRRSLVQEMSIAPGVRDATTFTHIHEFVVDVAGSLWVYDNPSNTVFVFDSAGTFQRRVGRDGKGPGEFRFNGGMVAMADGRVAISDDANSWVSFFSSSGVYQAAWHFPVGAVRRRALLRDASGQLYVKRTVFPDGDGNREPKGREALIRVRDGGSGDTLFPPDMRIPEIHYAVGSEVGDNDTHMSAVTEAMYAPKMLWDWHPDGFFVTGHGALYQITLFRTQKRPIRIERAFTRVPVTAAEREVEERLILGNSSRRWRGPPLPETKPPLMDLFVAGDGRIWARVAAPSITTVVSNPDKRPGKPQTVTTYHTPGVWEVFSPEGEFLWRITFPGRARPVHAEGNHVWAIQVDDDDLQSVVRYRIEGR